jgi:hypothetical protein
VRTIECAGLVACVSTVPLDRFGAEPLRRSLEDLDWLSDTARAHHGVVEAVVAAAPTAPVRLVTVYSDDDQVRDLLHRRRADFLDVLSRVTGRQEWGVKAYVVPVPDSPVATDEAGHAGSVGGAGGVRHADGERGACGAGGTGGVRHADGEACGAGGADGVSDAAARDVGGAGHVGSVGVASAGGMSGLGDAQGVGEESGVGLDSGVDRPGTAYLKRRQANLRGRAEAQRRIAERAGHIHAVLRDIAVESRLHRAQDPQLSGRDDWMVLNGAYLVEEARAEEFLATLAPLRGEGIEVQLTGPWAAYSFTALELDPVTAGASRGGPE